MHWKLRVIKHWMNNSNEVTLRELLRVIIDFSYKTKSKRRLERINVMDECLEIILKNYREPLYIPKGLDLDLFYLIMEETFNKDHWHYYQIPQTRVEEDDVVLDCGAAEGLFTYTVAKHCKKVYAIEPVPDFVRCLRKSFANRKNIEIIPGAISDQLGVMYLDEDTISSYITDEFTNIKVDTWSIDDLFYKNSKSVDYIKADLEGQELKMLKGAKETIRKYKPKMAITTYHNIEDAEQIYNYIKSIDNNYNIKLKGIQARMGSYTMLHAWPEKQ
ncbi:FkbM family methyltransferase [Alkalibaculum bacchi]|uniref:FkbM family methyltransferase n=2 Tax=Alkalibaculum bacchi TaxID=645887 RepID=A0A366IAY7_9FIRM|nr:FkbM family methyltransferase [Alkalibaculum bacchi]RBP65343.1 FkbM family methyltransferase [Alkalibaculum bacchi]